MALSRGRKEEILAALVAEFQSAKSAFFTSYTGLSVDEISKLRSDLRASGAKMTVAKKTLIQLAAKQALDLEVPADLLPGPIGVVFGLEDEIAAAKTVAKWTKDTKEKVALEGGIFEGRVLTKAEAVALSQIPSREELLAKLVGSLQSPISGFVRSLKSPLNGFTTVLRELSTKGN